MKRLNMAKVLPVRAEHKFDENSLHEYLKKNLPEFPEGEGYLSVSQFRFVILQVCLSQGHIASCIMQMHCIIYRNANKRLPLLAIACNWYIYVEPFVSYSHAGTRMNALLKKFFQLDLENIINKNSFKCIPKINLKKDVDSF